MVSSNDIVLAISNSGQTPEINNVLPILRDMGVKIISFAGRPDSPMALASDVVVDVGVEREACPMGLAPTSSTTAALAMGDALAVVLINARRFDKKDFNDDSEKKRWFESKEIQETCQKASGQPLRQY